MLTLQNSRIKISDHFTYGRLIYFTMPSIIMMLFASMYGVVDGFFVSRYAGVTAFASVNMILPFVQIVGGLGVVLGADGSVLIARTLGVGNREKAGRYFTMTMVITLVSGLLFTAMGLVALRPVAYYLGATKEMIDDCMTYGKICLFFNAALLAQNIFQGYLIVAGKPQIALRVMVLAGILNFGLNVLFVHPRFLHMGVAGAAWATGISQTVAALIPLLWFISKRNKTPLRFRRTKFEAKAIRRASITGSADAISSLSAYIIGILYNIQLMNHAGENGVAAYGVVMYASFVYMAVFSGYSSATSPIMGYHFGAENKKEMRNVFKKSIVLLACVTILMTIFALILAKPVAAMFVGYDRELLDLTTKTFVVCIIPYLVMWFNMYATSVLSALNKGFTAAFLTFLRVIAFPIACLIAMPIIWGLEGVWYALAGAEVLSVLVSVIFLLTQRRKFGRPTKI